MFELTNDQRGCFGLVSVSDSWERMTAKSSPYDDYITYLYLDGDTIVKCILCGDSQYCEYELSETVSADKKYLMPKTAKGKPVLLSSSTVLKRNGTGMHLYYKKDILSLYNDKTECTYYHNSYLDDGISDLDGFIRWVENWCSETTESDRQDLLRFSQQKRRRVRYQEGDVFRFKIDRRRYGYGRILLDYDKMRKQKEPFWDILMSKPVVCGVYHIATERDDVSVDELKNLGSLPSGIFADNALFYGEYEIIGNLPITQQEDYPIMYGNSIELRDNAVCYQCGKTYRRLENRSAIYHDFRNNGVSFRFHFTLDILLQCIKEQSNAPYWERYHSHWVERDLRNPRHAEKLKRVRRQFGLEADADQKGKMLWLFRKR